MFKTKTSNVVSSLILSLVSFSAIAEAPAAGAQPAGSPFGTGLIFVVIIVMMYFFMIRPQNKRAKDHRDLLQKLTKGDEILTSGGILGKIDKITDTLVTVEITSGVKIAIQKQAIAASLPKGTLKTVE